MPPGVPLLIVSLPRTPVPCGRDQRTVAERQASAVRWEVRCIQQALSTLGVPIILLKGLRI